MGMADSAKAAVASSFLPCAAGEVARASVTEGAGLDSVHRSPHPLNPELSPPGHSRESGNLC